MYLLTALPAAGAAFLRKSARRGIFQAAKELSAAVATATGGRAAEENLTA